ncbi:MAG: alpha/beta fold hydrolase [Deltaproteobacteria bacterium]|nr:alpha/beta fold hydrolase [Deltaproteobacteria bacterium]
MDSGDNLIFVHGWATDSWVWEDTVRAIGAANCKNINLPGHGGGYGWDEPTLAPALAEISKNISGLNEKSVIGIGWSLGAEALLASALEDQKRYKALVLVGATPCFLEKEDFPWGQPRALVKRMILDMKKEPAGAVNRFYPLNFTANELNSKAAEGFINRYSYPGPVNCSGEAPGCFPIFNYKGLTAALEALFNTDLRPNLKLSLPILLVHGGLDTVCPVDAGKYLASRMKGAVIEIFENAGHAPFITEAERFQKILRNFLDIL